MWPTRVHDVACAVGAAPHYLQLQADQRATEGRLLRWMTRDIAQFLLREGWAELPIDVTDQAYVEASELARSRGLGIWGDAPP